MAMLKTPWSPNLSHTDPNWFDWRLREIAMFFAGNDRVHETMRRVAARLEEAGIAYVIMGGMAVNAHGHERTTKDVNFLVTQNGLAEFRRKFVPSTIDAVPRRPQRFLDRETSVTFDMLVTGHFPGSGRPGPIAFPNPADVGEMKKDNRVVNLPTLIQLKLAARRHQDYADVVNLIHMHKIDEAFLSQLDPSVHRDFIECLEEKRREDDYEAREDEAIEKLLREKDASPPPAPGASG
jgi:hypothetical protein